MGGALLAAVIPACRAMSVLPLAAMAPQSRAPAPALTRWLSVVGLLMVAINPLLAYAVAMPDSSRQTVFVTIGCTTTALGFLLMAPLSITLAERWLGPVLARMLGLNPQLLASQLTTNLWRTLGTTVALSLGLGVFVATQIWGHSMLAPFLPGEWMPEWLVSISGPGIEPEAIAACAPNSTPAPGECLPLAVEQPKFAADVTGAKQRASVTRQDNCLLLGIDPSEAFAGERPLLELKFVAGDRQQAIARLRQGGHCLVPDHFERESGLTVGDTLDLIPPAFPEKVVTYTIAGVVALDGWHLASKGGLRTRSGRSAALVIAPFDAVRSDFGAERIRFLWMDPPQGLTKDALRASLEQFAAKQAADLGPMSPASAGRARPARVRVQSSSELREAVRTRAAAIIWGLSQLALVTLLVTTLGVMNTVLASIRATLGIWHPACGGSHAIRAGATGRGRGAVSRTCRLRVELRLGRGYRLLWNRSHSLCRRAWRTGHAASDSLA